VSQGLLYELPLRYKSGRHRGEAPIANAVADGRRRRVDRLDGRHDDDRGGAGVVGREHLTIVTNALNIASESPSGRTFDWW
jgi:hypothetical protein